MEIVHLSTDWKGPLFLLLTLLAGRTWHFFRFHDQANDDPGECRKHPAESDIIKRQIFRVKCQNGIEYRKGSTWQTVNQRIVAVKETDGKSEQHRCCVDRPFVFKQ